MVGQNDRRSSHITKLDMNFIRCKCMHVLCKRSTTKREHGCIMNSTLIYLKANLAEDKATN